MTQETPSEQTVLSPQAVEEPEAELWYLDWAAISDVGRVRKDNQDSGYAGPHLLAVCDGVGGAARGDIASATAIGQVRRLDSEPGPDLLTPLTQALVAAHERIGDLVEEDPSLSGTSTTATLTLFDGRRIGVGHVGDSRAYLLREGQLAQLTHDHTFVQSLIDEGRITEAEARVHPHRNLILKALDASQDPDPDLSYVDLRPGDRLLLCSDGACGYVTDDVIAEVLATGTPDFAAVELTRISLESGSTDNVTCIVADVVAEPPADKDTLLVGAAAELPRKSTGHTRTRLRGFRTTDVVDLEDLPELPEGAHPIANDPIDPEDYRYALRQPEKYRWARRGLAVLAVLGVLWIGVAAAWAWSQHQFYVGVADGKVTVFRGINAEVPGIDLSHPFEISDVEVARLSSYYAEQVTNGIEAKDLADARATVVQYAKQQDVG